MSSANSITQGHLNRPSFKNIQPDQIEAMIDHLLQQNRTQIAEIIKANQTSYAELVNAMEDLDVRLNNLWGVISHLHSVQNSEAMRKPYENALQKITEYGLEINQNETLYQQYLTLKKSAEFASLSPAKQKVLNDILLDFELSGVNLDADKKTQFQEISKSLVKYSTEFENHVLDATDGWFLHITDEKDLQGIPETNIKLAQQKAKEKNLSGWILTLDFPSYYAVMAYADQRELRQKMYTQYVTRASDLNIEHPEWDNTSVINELLKLRTEKAKLLGYSSYAHLSLARKMAKSPEEVVQFLWNLAEKSKAAAHREFQELEQYAKQNFGLDQLQPWDISYYSEKLRESLFSISDEQLRPYFPESKVMQGLFELIEKIFSIRLQQNASVEVWHTDAKYFDLINEKNEIIGGIYLDLYARAQKRGGAWMDDCRTRHRFNHNDLQLPIAYVICNFTPGEAPHGSLLNHEEVQTLFHEFGHALHHLLTQQDQVSISGINGVPWDGVEFPSQFMENFCWNKDVLSFISQHVESGESLPEDLLEKLIAARNFQSAMALVRQLEFSLFDFMIHWNTNLTEKDFVQSTLNQIRSKIAVVPIAEFNRFQHSFSHIFAGGYAAGYYSYKWAEVLSADAFSRFVQEGILNPKIGIEFRDKVLALGGSKDYAEVFRDFMGRDPDVNALLKQDGIL